MIEITYDPTVEDIRHILNNLREEDVRELECMTEDTDREYLTQIHFFHKGWKILFKLNGEPVAMYRFSPERHGVWHAFLMSTPKIESIKLSLIKHGKKIIFPTLQQMNARLIYTHSVDWRENAKNWLEYWGAKKESVLARFGKNSEDIDVFCWRKEGT